MISALHYMAKMKQLADARHSNTAAHTSQEVTSANTSQQQHQVLMTQQYQQQQQQHRLHSMNIARQQQQHLQALSERDSQKFRTAV